MFRICINTHEKTRTHASTSTHGPLHAKKIHRFTRINHTNTHGLAPKGTLHHPNDSRPPKSAPRSQTSCLLSYQMKRSGLDNKVALKDFSALPWCSCTCCTFARAMKTRPSEAVLHYTSPVVTHRLSAALHQKRPRHTKVTSKLDCCLMCPVFQPISCTWTHRNWGQRAATFCAWVKGNASVQMCKPFLWLKSYFWHHFYSSNREYVFDEKLQRQSRRSGDEK